MMLATMLIGIGVIFIYAAIKGKKPQDIIRDALKAGNGKGDLPGVGRPQV